MSIIQSNEGNGLIVSVTSDSLIKDEAMQLKITITELIDSGKTDIKLDLAKTKYIDSSGIGKLLFLNKKLEEQNGSLEIIAINKELYNFLDTLAITKVMKISPPNVL